MMFRYVALIRFVSVRGKYKIGRKSNFAVVRFFNMIGYTFRSSEELRARTNYIKEFYKAVFSAKLNSH